MGVSISSLSERKPRYECFRRLGPVDGAIYCVALSPNGNHVVCGGPSPSNVYCIVTEPGVGVAGIHIYDTQTGEEITTRPYYHATIFGAVTTLTWVSRTPAADGASLVFGTGRGFVEVWRTNCKVRDV